MIICNEAIQAIREGKIVQRASWHASIFVSPMTPERGRQERTACLCGMGWARYGWYPNEDEQRATDWVVVPFSAANQRYKPNFGDESWFRLGYNPRHLKIVDDILKATGLRHAAARDLLIDVARLENPRADLNDDLFNGLFGGWSDERIVAHVLANRERVEPLDGWLRR
jgi:hypothetical protein